MEQIHPEASIVRSDDRLVLLGAWTLSHLAALERQMETIAWPRTTTVLADAGRITVMDTAGAVCLRRLVALLQGKGRPVTVDGLRPEFSELLEMVSQRSPAAEITRGARLDVLERVGKLVWNRVQNALRALGFVGESTVTVLRALAVPQSIRWRSVFGSLELDGFQSLPITGLLTFLMGIVIAYQGAEQLRTVGANIFIVDLVGIALLREIAPLIVAILIAGRSGSAYTAQIGTMKVTEELDALRTLGLSPMKVLVLPKVLALAVALPLLTVYADIVGVFGGMLIAANQLSVSFQEFLTRFDEAVALRHFLIGIGKAPVFAAIIALVGCYQGFQIRGGVDDVGRHTTISVVQSIFLVIVFDACFSVLLNWWKL